MPVNNPWEAYQNVSIRDFYDSLMRDTLRTPTKHLGTSLPAEYFGPYIDLLGYTSSYLGVPHEFLREREQGRIFDWDLAAELIKQHGPYEAEVGIKDEWEKTKGTIYRNGSLVTNSSPVLYSETSFPVVKLDGSMYYCWKKSVYFGGFGERIKWPPSAIEILKNQ